MKLSDIFDADAIALNYNKVASNAIPYLGTGFFPLQKKAGLDLKWINGYNGLPISLMPSNFDAKSTFRDRIGVGVTETQMAFFRESMLVKEADEQEILRVQDSNDVYAKQVLDNIFNDTQNLIDGANVVPERMRMQLLAPLGGKVGINISSNSVDYTYDYDPSGAWKTEHYVKIATEADKWSNSETCDPLRDIENMLDMQEEANGNRPEVLLMSKKTFNYIKNSKKVRENVAATASLITAGIQADLHYTSARVKQYVEEELQIQIVVYNKKYKTEMGVAKNFYPDDIIAFLPSGQLGRTWYGTTPEELRGSQSGASVATVNTGVTIMVSRTVDPVNTKTTCSEIVLPSFERLSDTCALEVV